MKGSVRCNAITLSKLQAQETHGKRLDKSSKGRVVRDKPPLVGGGLDLVNRLKAHMEGTKQNKAANNVALHFIVRFPPEILDAVEPPGPFKGLDREQRQRLMMKQAAQFINEVHGGRAVFAVRMDRDEAGESIVDVFACPKYIKTTKKAETEWTSLTKFGKELAHKHQDEIRRRSPKHDSEAAITSPRAIGMALQSEFATFFKAKNGVAMDPKKEKTTPSPDRLEVEEWKLQMLERDQVEAIEAKHQAEAEAGRVLEEAESVRARAKEDRADFNKKAKAWVDRERASIADKHHQADQERRQATADLLSAQTILDHLTTAYRAVRASLPRIRQILTWDLATEQERRQAQMDRKQAVEVSPMLRRAIKRAKADGRLVTPETTPEADSLGLSM